jgi:hypothetical protein
MFGQLTRLFFGIIFLYIILVSSFQIEFPLKLNFVIFPVLPFISDSQGLASLPGFVGILFF